MDADSIQFNPPIHYSLLWLIIGMSLLVALGLWFSFIYWHTRRKKIKTIANLPAAPSSFDLEKLKQEYLRLIEEGYQQYKDGQTSLRGLHKGLSMATRYFVYEAQHFPAPRLTLTDLKRAPYPKLSHLIQKYYEKEFAAIEHGNPEEAVQAAKELVQQWV